MSNWKLSRRMFVGASGASLLLPLFESVMSRPARAQMMDPRRFVCFYSGNGTYNLRAQGTLPGDEIWSRPDGLLSNSLVTSALNGDVFTPFAGNFGDFSVLKYTRAQAYDDTFLRFPDYPIGTHPTSSMSYLTCRAPELIDPRQPPPQPNQANETLPNVYVPGNSFDQLYAQRTGKPAFTLHGHDIEWAFPWYSSISYLNGRRINPYNKPGELFRDFFAMLTPQMMTPGGPAVPVSRLGRNRSILDGAVKDLAELKAKLGRTDQRKLDDYLSSLRSVETKLGGTTQPGPMGASCQPIPAPASSLDDPDYGGQSATMRAKAEAFMDMVVLAFKCDLTRSVTLEIGSEYAWRNGGQQTFPAGSPMNYPGTNLVEMARCDDHQMAHYASRMIDFSYEPNSPLLTRADLITRDRFRMDLMMYLVNKLKSATDASGTSILDNSIITGGYGLDDGMHHNSKYRDNSARPLIVAGGRSMGLTPGRCFDASQFDLKDVWFTIGNRLGMGLNDFQGGNRQVPL